jgi:lipopolysaccharide heptosyltransferase II
MNEAMQQRVIGVRASVRRIAIVRALHLGDLLLAVPALRAVRARYPKAEITLIGLPWAEQFVRRFARYVDQFIAFPGYPGIDEEAYNPIRTKRFLAAQRARAYDLAIQMHGSGHASNPFALALGAHATVGYYEGSAPPGLSASAPYPTAEPEVMRNLGLAQLAGCRWLDATLEFPLTADDREEAQARLQGVPVDVPLIAMHVGAKSPSRRWPPDRFAVVANSLIERFGAHIVLTGSAEDGNLACAVRAFMTRSPLDMTGKTSLGGLAALLERASLFIGNDSGPAHLAEAVGTPSVTIFGPTDPGRWASLDQQAHRVVREAVQCSPCAYTDCPIDHRCLRRITPDEVLGQAYDVLQKGATACGA